MKTKRTNMFQIMLLILACFLSTEAANDSGDYDSEELTSDFSEPESALINQRGCRIPNFDLFSNDVMNFYGKEPDLDCGARVGLINRTESGTNRTRSPLFTEDTRFLYFNASALSSYDSEGDVTCTYTSFQRVEGPEDNVNYSECKKPLRMDQPNEITDEFIKVDCKDNKSAQSIYKDYFAFLPLKEATEKRCEDAERNQQTREPWLNTLVVGLDTISRLQFHRHFNRSAKFLKERLDAIEMFGYNKVAENTYPNLVSLLSGLSANELNLTCLDKNNQLADECPIIWKKYHEKGFRTVFVEDAPNLNIFNYGARGFQRQPTDYYLRPMYLEYERNVGHDDIGCGYRCLGSRSSLSFLLNHAEKTARVFSEKKYFAFHWSCSATHDTFNIPAEVDETVEQFLRMLQRDNLLNNTLLVVMADHGPRIVTKTGFVSTRQGAHEKRLPLLMLVFPEWFKNRYSEAMLNLRRNTRMLTTHFDLHRTFYDLMNLNLLEKDNLRRRYAEERTRQAQGRSLFLPISTDRTCYQARIPSEHCACSEYIMAPLKTEKPFVATTTAAGSASESAVNQTDRFSNS